MSVSDSILTNNYASGGALTILQSKMTFTGTNIIMNNNGPIYSFSSRVHFNGPTTLSNNHGVLGGAISAERSDININKEGVIITNNTATFGGGIFLKDSQLFLKKPIKICHNRAQDGGGIFAFSSKVEIKTSSVAYPSTQSEIVETLLRIMVEVFMQRLQTLKLFNHNMSTLTQTQQLLMEVECIYSKVIY